MDRQLDEAPSGPLVTDEIRALIGREFGPFETTMDPVRLPLVIAEMGETGLQLDGEIPPWLVVGVGLHAGLHEAAPQLLPETALIQVAWEFFAPVRLGTPLHAVARVDDIRDRIGGRYGHTIVATVTADLRDPGGRTLASYQVSRVQFRAPAERLPAPPQRSAIALPATCRQAAESTWPGRPRRFDEASEGMEVDAQTYLPSEATIKAFLPKLPEGRLSQSNDMGSALRQGYEGLVVPISAQLCVIARQASQWAGDPRALRLVRGAFREPDYLGRPITFLAKVAHRERGEGHGTVDLECGAYAGGHQSVRATVRVALGAETL